jgi:hypothetical protein
MAYHLKKDNRIIPDIEEALSYYDSISFELGEKFESELIIALNKIENNPHHYFNLNQTLRRTNLQNFPYKLVYLIKEQTKEIIVLGLFHHYKNPQEIRKLSP